MESNVRGGSVVGQFENVALFLRGLGGNFSATFAVKNF